MKASSTAVLRIRLTKASPLPWKNPPGLYERPTVPCVFWAMRGWHTPIADWRVDLGAKRS